MTTINANLQDSLGNALTGYIRVTLSYDLVAADDSIHTIVPAIVPLVAGAASFDLEPSEQEAISYQIEYVNTAVTPEVLIKTYWAKVPDSPTAINIGDLEPSGVTQDRMDTSFNTIARRLYANDAFWDRFQANILALQGQWSPTTWYKRGNIVYHQGASFCYIGLPSAQGEEPVPETTTAYWTPVSAQGEPGSGSTGSMSLYSAVAWLNSNQAVSQHAVRDIVENIVVKQSAGLAPLNNPTLVTPRVSSRPAANDNSNLIPDTGWVRAITDELAKAIIPIGFCGHTAATSAPLRWLVRDGRAVSRTTYAQLFAIIGTTYGAGDGSTTFNLPDARGRADLGVDVTPIAGAANRVAAATTVSQAAGAASKTLSVPELPSHSHGVTDPGHSHQTQVIGGGVALASGSSFVGASGNTSSANTGITIQNTGSGQSFSLMNPYQALLPIIYAGV